MPDSQLKEKMFKCFVQRHKNKENRETSYIAKQYYFHFKVTQTIYNVKTRLDF